ncbi:hypothetical protein M9H77_07397 [Catharanthus roseus]|uniref:Uncharacterized protein n=1 Tax=Catharanthus roseus TaxID=4058 RepID=A0ACC0BUT7_CATRO|nr:hypothetical protein M9H77_07397 [Catharanthus roseus]
MYRNIPDYSTSSVSRCGLFKMIYSCCEVGFGYTQKRQRIALYVASPPYEGIFRWSGRFRLERVDLLEEGHRPRRVWPNRSRWTLHHALRWGSTVLLESREGLETEINSGHTEAWYTAEVLGLEFWIHFSLEGYVFIFLKKRMENKDSTLNLE